MKMWPYNPGGQRRGDRIRRGLLCMRHVAQYIKYLQSSICTHRIVYSHILIHRIISAFGVFINRFQVPDHILWDWSALRGVNRCGRPKQATSCCGDRSDIGCWRSRSCCVTLYRATFMGRGRDWLSEHAWLSVERLWDVTNMLRRTSQTRKNRI